LSIIQKSSGKAKGKAGEKQQKSRGKAAEEQREIRSVAEQRQRSQRLSEQRKFFAKSAEKIASLDCFRWTAKNSANMGLKLLLVRAEMI